MERLNKRPRGALQRPRNIFDAARDRNTGEIAQMLASGADPNGIEFKIHGAPPLATALAWSSGNKEQALACAKLLLDAGAEPNWCADQKQWGASTWAAINDFPEILSLLIERGASLRPERDGWTAMSMAARKGHAECIGVLAKAGAGFDRQGSRTDVHHPLALAILSEERSLSTIKALAKAGASLDEKDPMGRTAAWKVLAVSAQKEAASRLALLARLGASVDEPDLQGETIAMAAAKEGKAKVLAAAFAGGADARRKDRSGKSLMDWALEGAAARGSNACAELVRKALAAAEAADIDKAAAPGNSARSGRLRM